jgi:phage shock protein A
MMRVSSTHLGWLQVIASKKQIEAKYKQSKEAVAMWQSRAELAVQAGEDELAREALKKRKANEEQLKTWDTQLKQQGQAVDQLLANTRAMENKLTEAKSRKETLKARAASAKSSKEVRF